MRLTFMSQICKTLGLAVILLTLAGRVFSQAACSTLGQTPGTAFPVCGSTTFTQTTVPLCRNSDLVVPGCPPGSAGGGGYGDRNPFYYKFTCYVGGTLGFLIQPKASGEDYDWQLYDITGRNPNDIYNDASLVVTGNWSGSYGPTGASNSGVNFIQCASLPTDNANSFSTMPTLIAGHEYLLMISHFTDTQSGYDLSFGGGTAVITDPKLPLMSSAKPSCDGQSVSIKLNKRIRCNSITGSGSEFSISPALSTVISAVTDSCSLAFDFDDFTIFLSAPLPNGNYDVVINNGTDGNTLLDLCGNPIAQGQRVSFTYASPQPIFADSIGKLGCAPDSVKIYFPKKIRCNSIAPDGTDFVVSGGPVPVTVTAAYGNCVGGQTDYIVVKFSKPITVKGTYNLTLKAGDDGTVVIDECGQETPTQTLPFQAVDTVNADFTYSSKLGCLNDTITFTHNGAHDVNQWLWTFNNTVTATTPSHTIVFPSFSTNTIQLIVSNGICADTSQLSITLDNKVQALFYADSILCPEDPLVLHNVSSGTIDHWLWTYDVLSTSTLKDPPPFLFPTLGREAYYTVKLLVTNDLLHCNDSVRKVITVLDFCYIDVPTAFTPNNDGLNDTFGPHNAIKADNYFFKVYNRWGQLVFQSRNWREKWDGRVGGVMQSSDVFVWMLSYTTRDTKHPVFRKGTVALIR